MSSMIKELSIKGIYKNDALNKPASGTNVIEDENLDQLWLQIVE